MSKSLTFLDLETSGLDPATHEILSIAIIDSKGKRHSALIKPTKPVDPEAAAINGYTEAGWVDALDFIDVAPLAIKYLKGTRVVGHNVKFDLDFLRTALVNHGYSEYSIPFDHIDTVSLARAAFPTLVNHKLITVASALHISFTAHDALADIVATKEIFDNLTARLSYEPVRVEIPKVTQPAGFADYIAELAQASVELI